MPTSHTLLQDFLLQDFGAVAVYDLSPGSGLLAKTCLNLGLPYLACCRHPKQVAFLQNVCDRAALAAMTKAGTPSHCKDTAVLIEEHFKDILAQWGEMASQKDTSVETEGEGDPF